MLLEKSICYDQHALLTELCEPFPCFILYSKAKLACYSRYLLTSYFCIPVLSDEKDISFGAGSTRFPELTEKKDILFITGAWNAKVGSQEIPGVTGKFGLGVQN